MNRILIYGLAATFVTMLTPPVFAKGGGGNGGGGRGGGGGGGGAHFGGGGGAHFSAPAQFSAPHVSAPMSVSRAPTMRSVPSAPRIATQSPQFRTAPTVRSRPNTTFTPSVAQQRQIRGQRNAPTVAFGGTANNNAALNAQSARNNFAANNQARTFSSRDARNFRVPREVSRDWDHGRVHEWNHRRFRFFNNEWVILDGGFPYDYGYYDNYDEPYSDYTYNSTSPGSLVMGAQDRLNRLGYSAGAVDGVFGSQTRNAIMDFQNDSGLPATGSLDTATVRALGL